MLYLARVAGMRSSVVVMNVLEPVRLVVNVWSVDCRALAYRLKLASLLRRRFAVFATKSVLSLSLYQIMRDLNKTCSAKMVGVGRADYG